MSKAKTKEVNQYIAEQVAKGATAWNETTARADPQDAMGLDVKGRRGEPRWAPGEGTHRDLRLSRP